MTNWVAGFIATVPISAGIFRISRKCFMTTGLCCGSTLTRGLRRETPCSSALQRKRLNG